MSDTSCAATEQPPAVAATLHEPLPPLMRRPKVESLVGLGTSSLYYLMARNQFPKPVKIGGRRVAWRAADVLRWIEERQS